MSLWERFFIALVGGIGLGFPIYISWVLARIGFYKRWYLARFIPGISFSNSIYLFPMSLFFLIFPVLVFIKDTDLNGGLDLQGFVWSSAGVIGFFLSVYMVFWTPRWAQPRWVLYLEDTYSEVEIQRVFIPAWRKLDKLHWSAKMDTLEGIEEMVAYARQGGKPSI